MKPLPRILVTMVSIGLTLSTLTMRANATGRLPGEVYRHLYSSYVVAPYQPPCGLCHLRGSTGAGTAGTPFALSMKARGLSANDRTSVATALDAMASDNVDSDGDGVSDVQEIEDDTDPNTPANVSLSGDTGPSAGCGGGQSPNSGGRAPAAGIAILFTLVFGAIRRSARNA